MRRWWLLLLALIVVAGAADAQDRLAAARREGKVVWHTALAAESAQRVAARFEQAYPGIKVEVHAARLFTDFIFTRDIQQLLADSQGLYAERRTDEVKKRFVDLFGA